VQAAVGVEAQGHVGKVRAPDGDRPGRPHPLHHRRVDGDDRLGEGRDTPGGREPGHVDVLLDGDRHPGQRANGLARGQAPVQVGGLGPRRVGQQPYDGIDPAVDSIDPLQVCLDDLRARHLALGHQAGQFQRTPAGQFVHRPPPAPCAGLAPARLRHHTCTGNQAAGVHFCSEAS
jgi:hypothetical protein